MENIAKEKSIYSFFHSIGQKMLYQIWFSGFTIVLFFKALLQMRFAFAKRREIVKQMYVSGIKSMLVCSIVALFGGMILSLHTGVELKRWGQQDVVPTLMINVMNKEMGAFLTGIILTAFSGAAMAAELATMKVSEEIDALEMMSINPVRFLVMPRIVALMIMLPTLSIYTVILGVFGGALISYFQLGLTFEDYYHRVYESIWLKDMYVGLLKSLVFGIIISYISCANGLIAENVAEGVGRATRISVVSSYLMILIVGYFITALFYGGFL
jgi:phospholipid/cholesterol/gamma-HCH transport system permease protein